MDDVLALTRAMDLRPPASETEIAIAEQTLGAKLPLDYVEFLRLHDGGEGPVGAEGWARFIPVEKLSEENRQCSELDHLKGFLVFGTNGADEAFVFNDAGEVLVVPWIGGREDAIPQGRFAAFVRRLADGLLFQRDQA